MDYRYNNLNQLVEQSDDGWKTYTTSSYDNRGNLILETYHKGNKSSVTGAYTYDETNKMVLGINDIGESSAYLYNGLGALVENTWIIKKNAYGYHNVSAGAVVDGETVVDFATGMKEKKEKKTAEEVAASPTLNKTSTVVKQFVVDFSSETYKPLMECEVNGLDYSNSYVTKSMLYSLRSTTHKGYAAGTLTDYDTSLGRIAVWHNGENYRDVGFNLHAAAQGKRPSSPSASYSRGCLTISIDDYVQFLYGTGLINPSKTEAEVRSKIAEIANASKDKAFDRYDYMRTNNHFDKSWQNTSFNGNIVIDRSALYDKLRRSGNTEAIDLYFGNGSAK